MSKRVPPGVGDGDCILTRRSPPLIHSEMFCQGLLYRLLGDWFVCTCMCRGAHTPVIHIHADQKRTSGPALPSSYSLQTKFFSESAGTCHFWLGLACQQTHAPPASSAPEPPARDTGTGIHGWSLCGCFRGSSGLCSYPPSHLSFPVSDFLKCSSSISKYSRCVINQRKYEHRME